MAQTITRVIARTHGDDTATLNVLCVAPTCPSCDGHNVSDATGLGACGDCGLNDNMSAFMGGNMTAKAKFQPSKFATGGGKARSFDAPRAWTISGNVD